MGGICQLVLAHLLIGIPVIRGEGYCSFAMCHHNVSRIAPIRFTNQIDTEMFSPPGQLVDLDCCANGFTDVQWRFRPADNPRWLAWPWFKPCSRCTGPPFRKLCDMQQTLKFLLVSLRDSGTYMCNISNSMTGEYRIREQRLVVEYCDNIEGNIVLSDQPDSLQQHAGVGTNLTLTCAGYFGCPFIHHVRQANWSYVSSDGTTTPILEGDTHFSVQYNKSFPYIRVGSILTIVGVREEDYQLRFRCDLNSSVTHKSWQLTLQPPDHSEVINMKVLIISISCGGGIVFIIIIAVTLVYCHHPVISYHVRRVRGTLIVRDESQEDHHDGCIIHSEENEDFVDEQIHKPLKDENYDIFTRKQLQSGKLETVEADIIDKSMCVVLVLSQAEINDHGRVKHLFNVAVNACGTNIIVIDMVDGWQKKVKGEKFFETLPKILKTVKWHGKEKMSKRQLKNFIFQIKLKLPDPHFKGNKPKSPEPCLKGNDAINLHHTRIQSDSSTVPLLNRTSSLISQTRIQFDSQDSPTFSNMPKEMSDPSVVVVTDENEADVFLPKHSPPTPHKQLSHDSGIAQSPI